MINTKFKKVWILFLTRRNFISSLFYSIICSPWKCIISLGKRRILFISESNTRFRTSLTLEFMKQPISMVQFFTTLTEWENRVLERKNVLILSLSTSLCEKTSKKEIRTFLFRTTTTRNNPILWFWNKFFFFQLLLKFILYNL